MWQAPLIQIDTGIRFGERDLRSAPDEPLSEFDHAVARGEFDAAGFTPADRRAQVRREVERSKIPPRPRPR